ncbi:MAG TPA: glycosyltransferase, partial [Actinotalea sp.]|nr:glycosyltransferase [Actinotalea sp.]
MSAVVVIPAHNEAAVIGRCLDRLAAGGFREDELTVVVTANGCTDATAEIARAHPLRPVVIDRPEPGKPAALNAADAAVPGSPRVYLDADIELGARALRDLLAALSGDPSVLAAAPSPRFRTDGCSVLVKAYYSIWRQMPVLADSYVGSGVFGLSAAGHARVAPFPEVIAEDEYVRRSFSSAERRTTPGHF